MKSFTTTQDMTQYEVSQDYCEPYLGATHDDLQAARFNKYDTHIDKNEFFIYDDVNHKYNIYRRVEYIQNPSTAYIDTGFKPNQNTLFIIDGKYTTSKTDAQNGCYGNARFHFGLYSGSFQFGIRGAGNWSKVQTQDLNRHVFQINGNGKVKIDANEYNLNVTMIQSNANIFLFSRSNSDGGTSASATGLIIYNSKIYNGNTLVRDFIPVKNTLTNQYGLLDTVEQKFYVSPNGVEFNGGNEIIEDKDGVQYYIKNYINVSNNQRYVCTFNPKGNDSWEGKFHFNGTGRQDILGAWNSQGQRQFGFMGVDNNQMRFLYNTQTIYTSGYNIYGNKTFTLKTNKNKFYIYDSNNTLMYQSSATYVSDNHPVRYFGIGHLEGSVYASDAKMYYFKYWQGDTLIFDFIPVQRISDNVYGLYDKITNVFYQSNGGTEFTGG